MDETTDGIPANGFKGMTYGQSHYQPMRNDFKTLYGDGVEVTDFEF